MNREEKIKKSLEFHIKKAPGIYLAVLMLEVGEKYFEFKPKTNFAVETTFCLPDPIQLLCGATLGNRYLRLETRSGRYAYTAFNRETGEGIRVFLDATRITKDKMPYFWEFYFRKRDLSQMTRQQHNEKVIEEILKYGDEIIGVQKVKVFLPPKEVLKETAICEKCGEAFLKDSPAQTMCLECQSDSPYYQIEERLK